MPESIRGVGTTTPVTPTATGQAGAARSTDAASETASSSSTAPASVDLANVSQTEALLQTIVEAANNVPGIDQAKIVELQQAIASGVYRSNPKGIAEKLAELETMLAAAGVTR